MKPSISVIMSVFNGEKYLAKAILSILNQTITEFEFLIIDDGSKDSSVEIIQSFALKDPRIQVIINKENIGLAKSLNKGIRLALGEFIARMDADDVCFPDRFEKQINFLDKHHEIVMVGSNIYYINEDDVFVSQSNFPCRPGQVRWRLLFGCPIAHSAVMIRKSIFSDGRFFYNETYSATQDYELWVRISNEFKIANLPDLVFCVRKHDHNISKTHAKIQKMNEIEVIKNNIRKTINQNISDFLIPYFKSPEQGISIQTAMVLSKLLIRLERKTRGWDIHTIDRVYIRSDVAKRLREIWNSSKRNIFLLQYVIYSFWLDPSFFIDRIKGSTLW